MIFYFGDTSFSTILTSCLSSHLSAALSAGVRLSLCQHLMFSSLQRCWQWKADVRRRWNTEQDGASERMGEGCAYAHVCQCTYVCINSNARQTCKSTEQQAAKTTRQMHLEMHCDISTRATLAP